MRSLLQGLTTASVATVVAGCGLPGSPLDLVGANEEVAFVGQELLIELQIEDAGGSGLSYRFDADVPDIQDRGRITQVPGGAEFRWTPLAGDIGEWDFEFRVTDGSSTGTKNVRVDVRSAVGESPIFRKPVGSGTTLNTEEDGCVEIDIAVDSQTAAQVQLSEQPPGIENAEFEQTSGLEGVWRWCPSVGQIDKSDQYRLVLVADDDENPPAKKEYLIVLQDGLGGDCPGEAPVVTHEADDQSTVSGLTISAEIADEVGLKHSPILYYSEQEPAEPPDLGAMNPVEMLLIDGDRSTGVWAADVPNPVAGEGEGSQAEIYYAITARSEGDDEDKKCSNFVQSPQGSSYAMTVTNPGGAGDLAACEPCASDVQCGGGDDLCVRVGGDSGGSCLESCTSGSCPSGYTCSDHAVTSVDGETGRQCIPDTGTCRETAQCEEDEFAPNYGPADAAELDPGSYELNMCSGTPGQEANWFYTVIEEDTLVSLELVGGNHTDLDLWLLDPLLGVIESSLSFDSEEEILTCVPEGAYYIVVDEAFIFEENAYTLTYEQAGADCSTFCEGDEFDDDTFDDARVADAFPDPYESHGTICPDESDFFEIFLLSGDTLTVELFFEQTNMLEELNLRFYDGDENLLTPCSEEEPELCSDEQGQSVTSNELFEFEVEESGFYFVEVWGFAGSSNDYEIRMELDID